jgi:phospholipase C
MHDLASGRLPHVSWLHPSLVASEHPGYSSAQAGEQVARHVVEALISHPKTWRRTALLITWDENGGFFDHVAPPVAPHGTKGEYLTVARLPSAKDNDAQGIRGPIGLGFRVPTIVVSPFSRGGLVCSDIFDHTSMLRFLETRFRARVPNLSHWRRRVTGDLTAAFNFAATPSYGRPRLAPAGSGGACTKPTPVTAQGAFPRQSKGRRRKPSGL